KCKEIHDQTAYAWRFRNEAELKTRSDALAGRDEESCFDKGEYRRNSACDYQVSAPARPYNRASEHEKSGDHESAVPECAESYEEANEYRALEIVRFEARAEFLPSVRHFSPIQFVGVPAGVNFLCDRDRRN